MTAGHEIDPPRVRQDDEDLGFDLGRFVALLWRFRLVILLVSLVGGAVGFMFTKLTPVSYLGTSQLTILQALGSAAATDAVARYQPLLEDEAVIAAAVTEAGLTGIAAADVRGRVSSRVAAPGNILIVELRWPEPNAAGSLATSVSRGALATLRSRHAEEQDASRFALEKDLKEAEVQLAEARATYQTIRRSGVGEVSRTDLDSLNLRRRELQEILVEIPTERARLQAAQERLEQTPTFLSRGIAGRQGAEDPDDDARRFEPLNPAYNVLVQQVATSEVRLAGLAARHEYLEKLIDGSARGQLLTGLLLAEITQTQAQSDMTRAQQTRDRLFDAVALARRTITQGPALDQGNEPPAPGRIITASTTGAIARGMASGFLLAVFAVFFFNGMAFSFFGRRA